jgi:hypothetical protein
MSRIDDRTGRAAGYAAVLGSAVLLLAGVLALERVGAGFGSSSAAAATATAKKSAVAVSTRTRTVITTRRGWKVAIAKCPSGTQVVGGGFRSGFVRHSKYQNDYYDIKVSRRLGDDRWMVGGRRRDARPRGNKVRLTAYARCSSSLDVTETQASVALGPAGFGPPRQSAGLGTASATCVGGTSVIGGGFVVPQAWSQFPPWRSFRTDAGSWDVSAVGAKQSAVITSYAYCANASPALQSGRAWLPGEFSSVARAVTAKCPADRSLIGGGHRFFFPTPGKFVPVNPTPLESRPFGNRWRVAAVAQMGPAGIGSRIHAQSVCL